MKTIKYFTCFLILFTIQSIYSQAVYWNKIGGFNYVWDIKINSLGDLFICRQESGGIRRSTDDGQTWEFLYIQYTNIYKIAINDSDHIFLADRYNLNNSIYKSTDNGNSWIQCSLTGGRMTSIHISKEGYIYAGNDNGVFFKSTDNGASWNSVSVSNTQINCIGSCLNGQIFVGTNGNGIYSSTDFGNSWYKDTYINGTVESIVVNDSDHIFVANSYSVLLSKDYGQSWDITGNFSYYDGVLGIDSIGTIYAGYYEVFKSTDNGLTWNNMGGPSNITAIDTYGENVYLSTYSGVYRYDPNFIPPTYEANYVPLNVGNKWQYLNVKVTNYEWYYYSIDTMEVIADTIISNKKYFKLDDVNDWIRFSYPDQRLYIFWNDSDYVNMDFNVEPGSSFQQLTFNTHVLRNVYAIHGERQIFDSTLIYKGYEEIGSFGGSSKRYTASFGETDNFWAVGGDQSRWNIYFDQEIIQAILFDSSGAPNYYTYNNKPEIIFDPIYTTSGTQVTFDFQVNHPYIVGPPPNPFSNGRDFIDSVIIQSFYSKNGNIINNNPIYIPSYDYRKYRKTVQLVDSLFTSGFNFYYKIKAKDKGIIPQYDFDPDGGYYELKYINPNIQFYPATDTVFVKGGCTTPEMLCFNLVSTPLRDSISIEAGSNTSLEYLDSLGNPVYVDNFYFLVIDSLDQFEYELWYYPKTSPPFDSVLIIYDSTFFIDQHNFNIELRVKLNGIPISSRIQSFSADWGLGVGDDGLLPKEYKLSQNYPNPFNHSTIIEYQIPEISYAIIKLYDVLGNEVTTLLNEESPVGYYRIEFNASSLSSGIYFYRIQAGSFIDTRKMILLK